MLNVFEERQIKIKDLPLSWQNKDVLEKLENFLEQNWKNRTIFYDDRCGSSHQQFLSFNFKDEIRTNNYIGTIVFNGEQLNIFPKVFNDNDTSQLKVEFLIQNVVKWINYCNKFDYPFIKFSANLHDVHDMRDLLVTLYVHYVLYALKKGLYYQYNEKTEDCLCVKGKLNVSDFAIRKMVNGKMNQFSCNFSSFEYDNQINRIIKHTCKTIMNVASKSNQKMLRTIISKLSEVSDVKCSPYDCDKIRLNKSKNYYSIIISMSKIFLLNKTTGFNNNVNESFCFLFPTHILFEGFVGGFMKNILLGKADVKMQASEEYLFEDILYNGESYGRTLRMKHDILVDYKDKGIFILDTKYKIIPEFNKENVRDILTKYISVNDIYQILSYARTRNVKDVYLLYPMSATDKYSLNIPCAVNNVIGVDDKINVHFVKLPYIFSSQYDTHERLKEIIEKMFS